MLKMEIHNKKIWQRYSLSNLVTRVAYTHVSYTRVACTRVARTRAVWHSCVPALVHSYTRTFLHSHVPSLAFLHWESLSLLLLPLQIWKYSSRSLSLPLIDIASLSGSNSTVVSSICIRNCCSSISSPSPHQSLLISSCWDSNAQD